MKKPTQAGLKVLSSFLLRPTDEFEATKFRMSQIHTRSGLRSVSIYRVVEKLEADGFLSSHCGFEGAWYYLTDKGRAAIFEA